MSVEWPKEPNICRGELVFGSNRLLVHQHGKIFHKLVCEVGINKRMTPRHRPYCSSCRRRIGKKAWAYYSGRGTMDGQGPRAEAVFSPFFHTSGDMAGYVVNFRQRSVRTVKSVCQPIAPPVMDIEACGSSEPQEAMYARTVDEAMYARTVDSDGQTLPVRSFRAKYISLTGPSEPPPAASPQATPKKKWSLRGYSPGDY